MKMPLIRPFTTSFGTTIDRQFWLVEAVDTDGVRGWGETVAMAEPWYNEETVVINEHIIADFLAPILRKLSINHPSDLREPFTQIRRNFMARAGLEGAVYDLFAKKEGRSLSSLLGGVRERIEVGVSIGIQPHVDQLMDIIDERVAEGYKRIKVKIQPGWDVEILKTIRHKYPDIPLMADANSAYTLDDLPLLKQLDAFDLMMVEQPLAHDDIIDHQHLQTQINTPVCLDESIHSLSDTRKALDLGSCKIINVKIGRVGGLAESKRIHDYCVERDVPLWCGGMLESGVGRAHNIAIASLKGFCLPGDTAGSDNYWKEDIVAPTIRAVDGVVNVPSAPGIGFEVNREMMRRFRLRRREIKI